jgi:uncharacterized delta-60 repeat protein
MRKTIVLGITLILVQIPLLAYVLLQQRTWGGADRDGANAVAVAADGSVYVTGSTRSFGTGDDDAFLLKYGPDGSLLWQRTYGTAPDAQNSGQESGIGVAVPPDRSGVLVLGNYRDGNIFLAKFSPAGVLLWDLTWGGGQEGAGAIAVAPNGNIYVTGITFGFGAGQGDAFLLSLSSTGALNWQRTWGGEFFDSAHDVAVASDGSIYISGDTIFSANSAFLVKFDAAGSVLWQREWGLVGKNGVPGETQGHGVAAAPAGGAYVAGSSTGAGADPNLLAVRFDTAGNFVWQRVGGPGFGTAQDVAVGTNGNVHVTGNVLTNGGASGANAFVWTLTANGKADDAAVWGGGDPFETESGASIATAPDGAVLLVGSAGASPYTFARGSKTAKSASTFLATIAGTITEPAGVVGTPAAVVNIPPGSQTFAGVSDAFLIRVQQ